MRLIHCPRCNVDREFRVDYVRNGEETSHKDWRRRRWVYCEVCGLPARTGEKVECMGDPEDPSIPDLRNQAPAPSNQLLLFGDGGTLPAPSVQTCNLPSDN